MGLNIANNGGTVQGDSNANATQSASVSFVPTVDQLTQPIVSAYPAGQGLATLNTALPGSAAYLPATYAGTTSTSALSATTLLLLAGLALGAWYFLRKR